jgi:hypothetical protein
MGMQVATDAEAEDVHARLGRLHSATQVPLPSAQAPLCTRSPATQPDKSDGAVHICMMLTRALPPPRMEEFQLPCEYSLMRDIPYQQVDVNKYTPEHRPKKLKASAIQVRSDPLAHVMLRQLAHLRGHDLMKGEDWKMMCRLTVMLVGRFPVVECLLASQQRLLVEACHPVALEQQDASPSVMRHCSFV